jgi:heme-degrading monooxygenase HmoA
MYTNVADKMVSVISSDDRDRMLVWTTSVHFYHTTKYHNQNIAGSRHTAYQNTVLLPQNFAIQH